MHRIMVDEKRWVGENRFLHALSYCMLLPGPEAHQLATYIGWLMHRWPGATIAGGLFVLPGIVSIMALSYIYAAFDSVPAVAALFLVSRRLTTSRPTWGHSHVQRRPALRSLQPSCVVR